MEPLSISTILSVIVGGSITFLTSYFLEARKAKNEKFKFKLEKVISVGEDFYRFSAYALLRFETLTDSNSKILSYSSEEARKTLINVDRTLKALLTKIGENNITITAADIFFGVSGAEAATRFMNAIKTAEADFQERLLEETTKEEIIAGLSSINTLINNYVIIIKADRETIRKKILELLEIERK